MTINEICEVLELDISVWKLSNKKLTVEQAKLELQIFKDLVKRQRKTLAKKYHPDKTGGDDTKIKEINNVVDAVMELSIHIKKGRTFTQSTPIFYSFTDSSTTHSFHFFDHGFRFYR